MPDAPRVSQPQRMLRGARALSLVVAILLAVDAMTLWNRMNGLIEQDGILQKAMREIALLDERLTMSAYLYAQTGESQWEDRYQQADLRLREVIGNSQAQLESQAAKAELSQLAMANDRLVALEEESKQLAKLGSAAEAAAILDGPAYAREKENYARRMQNIQDLAASTARQTLAQLWEATWFSIVLAALCVLGLLIIFNRLGRSMRDYEHERALAVAELDKLALVARETRNAVIITDREGRIEWVNAGFTHLTGYGFDEALGAVPGQLLQGQGTDPGTIDLINAALAQGEPIRVEILNYAKDGREYWLDMQIQPIRDDNGEIRQFMAIESDITERKAVEGRLRALSSFQERLLEAIPNPIFYKDNQGVYLGCNQAFESFIGKSRQEIVGGTAYDIAPRELADIYHRADLDLMAQGGIQSYEASVVHSDSSRRQVVFYKAAYGEPGEAPLGMVGTILDVTANNQIRDQLAREKALLRALIDSIPDLIFFKDVNSVYLGCNRAFTQLAGRPEAEQVGRTDFDFFDADTARFFREMDQAMLSSGESRSNEEWVTYPDGRQVLLDTLKTPFFDAEGQLLGLIGISRDITERKRIETALQEKEAEIRAVLENVADGIVTIDAEGLMLSFNKAAESIFGYTPEQVLGRNVSMLMPQPHRDAHDGYFEAYLRTGIAHIIGQPRELEGLRADGNRVALELAVTEFRVGERRLFTGVMRDITERKRVIRELKLERSRAEAANTAKSAFLANMSHEIRTPMNAIIGMSDLLLSTELTNRQRNYANKIKGASDSLLHIINDIMDFSKIEAGKLAMERVPFVLEDVLDALSGVLALRAERQGVEMSYDIHDDSRLLLGDPLRLGQILINLVGNAIKFSVGGNVIVRVETLNADAQEAELHFAISDEGIGMTPEQIEQIFKPFSQADVSTTRKYGGTGLGLAICKHLTEAMNGRIWVESELERGSVFHFTIKLGVSGADRRDGIAKFAAGLAEHAHRPLLLIDDNPIALNVLGRLIEHLGLSVAAARSCKEVLARLDVDDAPDYLACLIDWRMPDIDGIETIRNLRNALAARGRRIPPMLLVTANSHQFEMEVESHEIDGLLAKPVTARLLYVELARCLGTLRDEVPAIERRKGNALQWSRFRRLDILVVEDIEINREVILELLANVGLSTRLARNGAEALAAIEEKRPDLVLMDIQMPVMDGYEATRRLRAQAAYRDLPIIALTANATLEDQEKCIAVGMNTHVAKPIRMEVLFERMVKCLPDVSATTSPVGPVAATPPVPALPSLPGIDMVLGLAHADGRPSLLLRVLKQFRDKMGKTFEAQMNAARDAEDWKEQRRLAHSLKGVALTLGATTLAESANALQDATEGRDAMLRDALLADTLGKLGEVLAGLADLDMHLEELK